MLAASLHWQPVCLKGLSDGEGQRSWQDANGCDANELRANKQALPSPPLTSDLLSCLFNTLTGKMRWIHLRCQKLQKQPWIAMDGACLNLVSTNYSLFVSHFTINETWFDWSSALPFTILSIYQFHRLHTTLSYVFYKHPNTEFCTNLLLKKSFSKCTLFPQE